MQSTALVTAPLGILALLLASVALSDVLGRLRAFKRLGAATIVIIIGALLANFRIIPPASAGGPIYDPIFSYVIPGAVFLVLLDVNLAALRRAGAPMLGAFFLGAFGTFAGVWVANALTPAAAMLGEAAAPLAGMFTGTYIGGSANFNAVAIAYDITRDGGLYTAATVVDNVMTDVWIIITLILPALLLRTPWFRARTPATNAEAKIEHPIVDNPLTGTLSIAVPLALAALALWASDLASAWLVAHGINVPSILIVTTLALIAAQIPIAARLTQSNTLGLWGIYLFLAVVGANADLAALVQAGALTPMLFAYVSIIFVVHAAILLGIGALLKLEPVVLALASSANIGGSSTAFVLAEAEGRQDLVLPAILIGAIGTATGTYAGFAMVALLR